MNPVVTPTWLSARLQDPNTIILDATLAPALAPHPPSTLSTIGKRTRNSLKVGRLSAEVLLKYYISNHVLTIFSPRFHQLVFASVVF